MGIFGMAVSWPGRFSIARPSAEGGLADGNCKRELEASALKKSSKSPPLCKGIPNHT